MENIRILVIGGGGREHAIAWKLAQSKKVKQIFCAPGNAGTAMVGNNVPIQETDIADLLNFAKEQKIDLTVVGPEVPLMMGIVDEFRKAGLTVFGPTKSAAMLEGSKVFAKEFMTKNGIPTAAYQISNSRTETEKYVSDKAFPYVLKVDGLAAGKGALIIQNEEDLSNAFDEIYTQKKFGRAADRIIIEDFLKGEELSVFALTDGNSYVVLHPAQDHKRVFDDDNGPNTGGMGAYAPAPLGTREILQKVEEKIIQPVLKGMRDQGTPYTGVLYCGLMIDNGEPFVVEFNARFGDPETQVVVPLIQSDFAELLFNATNARLAGTSFSLSEKFAACVVLASGGYPGFYEKGKVISGLQNVASDPDHPIFTAGVAFNGSDYLTTGGRVLGVTAVADSLKSAIDDVYEQVNRIHFDGMHYRKDIGQKAFITARQLSAEKSQRRNAEKN